MKKNRKTRNLKLNKSRIADLNNPNAIIGGVITPCGGNNEESGWYTKCEDRTCHSSDCYTFYPIGCHRIGG